MSETWGSLYYEVLGQIQNLSTNDMLNMSVRDLDDPTQQNRVTRLESFLNQRYANESLTSLSQAELQALAQAYSAKVVELTNGRLNSQGTSITFVM